MALSTGHRLDRSGSAGIEELAAQLDALRDEIAAFLREPTRAHARLVLSDRLRRLARSMGREHAAVVEELHACLVVVRATAVLGTLEESERARLEGTADRLEAWLNGGESSPGSGPVPAVRAPLRVAMLVSLAAVEALRAEASAADLGLELARLARAGEARVRIAREQPSAVVIDADLEGAAALVEKLLSDRATEAIPVVVLGSFASPSDSAAFVAAGVARCLAKPVSPGELHRALVELSPERRGPVAPIGETTLDRLGARLAHELQRGLCDAAADGARTRPIDMGDGSEVLGVLWDAVARIRQLVTARSRGMVRFARSGPEAALASSTWLDGATRRAAPERAAAMNEVRLGAAAPSLRGHTAVVADDDPSMSWFLSGVLREAGATVIEAFDGEQALDRIYRTMPDVVLSDIVMPGIDGHALCRAIKRDVALRSSAVVLLSWKRDLLQRMRELGAGADGYLLKESSARHILQRVHELLRPQRRVAERLAEGGTVRGRLDGLSPHALLRLACRLRPHSRLSVRDAHFVYTVQIRGGRPVSATRTGEDGATERGAPVLVGMLGVGDGRFGVEPVDASVEVAHELEGDLDDQLRQPIALARAAQALVRGQRIVGIERVQLDEQALASQLACTPEPLRGLLHAMAAGASPRAMIAAGRASAELCERLLDDAARRGAIRLIAGPDGRDRLFEAFERELSVVEGRADRSAWREVAEALDVAVGAEAAFELDDAPPSDLSDLSDLSHPAYPSGAEASQSEPRSQVDEADVLDWSSPVNEAVVAEAVAEAVGEVVAEVVAEGDEAAETDEPLLAAATPEAVVEPRAEALTPVLASAVVARGARRRTPVMSTVALARPRLAELSPPPDAFQEAAPAEPEQAPEPATPKPATPKPVTPEPPKPQRAPFSAAPVDEEPRLPRLPSAYATRAPEKKPERRPARVVVPVLFGAVGIVLAVGARWLRESQPAAPAVTMDAPPVVDAPPAVDAPAAANGPSAASDPEELPEELPLSEEDRARLRRGQGLLEVVAGRSDEIYVDGKRAGRGPVVKVPVTAGDDPHEIRVKMRGEERVRYVALKEATRVRVRVAPPWSR